MECQPRVFLDVAHVLLFVVAMLFEWEVNIQILTTLIGFLRRGGCPRGGGNWVTLGIPREDWGTLGKIRGITTPGTLTFGKSAKIDVLRYRLSTWGLKMYYIYIRI